MRHRPKRENYHRGSFGESNYQESLERYCTYLENRMKEKLYIVDCQIEDNLIQIPVFAKNDKSALSKVSKHFPECKPMIIDSEFDLSCSCR